MSKNNIYTYPESEFLALLSKNTELSLIDGLYADQTVYETENLHLKLDENGNSLLIEAAKSSYAEARDFIENYGNSLINFPNRNGSTPLSIAASRDNGELVKLLLENGADPLGCSFSLLTPLMLAVQYSSDEVINLLVTTLREKLSDNPIRYNSEIDNLLIFIENQNKIYDLNSVKEYLHKIDIRSIKPNLTTAPEATEEKLLIKISSNKILKKVSTKNKVKPIMVEDDFDEEIILAPEKKHRSAKSKTEKSDTQPLKEKFENILQSIERTKKYCEEKFPPYSKKGEFSYVSEFGRFLNYCLNKTTPTEASSYVNKHYNNSFTNGLKIIMSTIRDSNKTTLPYNPVYSEDTGTKASTTQIIQIAKFNKIISNIDSAKKYCLLQNSMLSEGQWFSDDSEFGQLVKYLTQIPVANPVIMYINAFFRNGPDFAQETYDGLTKDTPSNEEEQEAAPLVISKELELKFNKILQNIEKIRQYCAEEVSKGEDFSESSEIYQLIRYTIKLGIEDRRLFYIENTYGKGIEAAEEELALCIADESDDDDADFDFGNDTAPTDHSDISRAVGAPEPEYAGQTIGNCYSFSEEL